MPTVQSRKNPGAKMQAWSAKSLVGWISDIVSGGGKETAASKYDFQPSNPFHVEVSELFLMYFTNITPMFEINSMDTIRLVDYPTDYKTFLERNATSQNTEMFERFVSRIPTTDVQGQELRNFLLTFKNLRIVLATAINSQNEEYNYYTLNVGILNDACKRRFNQLMTARHNLAALSMSKVSKKISENEFRKFERDLRNRQEQVLQYYTDFWKQAIWARNIESSQRLDDLNASETEIIKVIATNYSITIEQYYEEERKTTFVKVEVRDAVAAKNSVYLRYFDELMSKKHIDNYKLSKDRAAYRKELADYICYNAALKEIRGRLSLVWSTDLEILGLESDYIGKRFLDINNLDESYFRNVIPVIIAKNLLYYLKVTPRELYTAKFILPKVNEAKNRFAELWNNCHQLISPSVKTYVLEKQIENFFLGNPYNLPDFIRELLNAAIQLLNAKTGKTFVIPTPQPQPPAPQPPAPQPPAQVPQPPAPQPPAPQPPAPQPPAPQPPAQVPQPPAPAQVPALPSISVIQPTPQPINRPQTVQVTSPFDDFFVRGVDTQRIRSDPTFKQTMETYDQRLYPRIVSIWYRWVDGKTVIDYNGYRYKDYVFINTMISKFSLGAIYNDPSYQEEVNRMAVAFGNSSSRFFDPYAPDEILLAISEMRMSIFDNLPLDRELVVWRGLRQLSDDLFNEFCTNVAVGQMKRFTRLSACSFSSKTACTSFASTDKSVLLRIIVPKGMKILNLHVISNKVYDEAEVIIPDNTIYQIVAIDNDDSCSILGPSTTCKKIITLRVESQWNLKMNRYEPLVNNFDNIRII